MPGVIGIAANDQARYSVFAASLTGLEKPEGTSIEWGLGSDTIRGRNKIVKAMLADPENEWLLFIDDDHCFGPDLLTKLLAHDVDVACGLYLQRVSPFAPIMFSHKVGNMHIPVLLHDHESDAFIPIHSAGTGAMLIRRHVLEAIPSPWFEHGRASEDLIFCDKVGEAGFEVWGDLGVRCGHMMSATIWPAYDQEWTAGLQIGNTFRADVAISKPNDFERLAMQARDHGAMQKVEELAPLLELVNEMNVTSVLEIGSGTGATMAAIARVADENAELISIDLPNEQFEYGISDEAVERTVQESLWQGQSFELIRKNSHEALEEVEGKTFDLLILDGDHSYEGTLRDFMDYSPLVRPGGLIVIHDILGNEDVPEIETKDAWGALKDIYNGQEICDTRSESWGGFGLIIKEGDPSNV